ncbi:hypothetical protein AX16_000290 [Volvariella volvacea WC 439]|nr:hypothetical protein AX16_000290 [Volvariella volvacea WC 439]
MAKGKNLNPADAYSQSTQRACPPHGLTILCRKGPAEKGAEKGKTIRCYLNAFALVKKDTSEIEDEITKLEGRKDLTQADRNRLSDLKSELEKINNKKLEYVKEHPEHRKLVFRPRKKDESAEPIELPKRNLFKKNGLPRHPERSIYYDPVMNPYGVPPPGMPYVERPLLPGEVDSQDEMDDDDVSLPRGPPPGPFDQEVTSDDDIPMPEGPPPEKPGSFSATPLLPPSLPVFPPLPPGPPPFPPAVPGTIPPSVALPPPPLPGQMPPFLPPPPPGALTGPFPPPSTFVGNFPPPPPPPPPGFSAAAPPPGMLPPTGLPPPPPGFFPRRQSASSIQDPLSAVPHQTYQAHRANKIASSLPAPHPSLPINPVRAAATAAATIEVAPQLRDFKKEATSFVPSALKRKKAGPSGSSSSAPGVNAAPTVEDSSQEPMSISTERPSLLGALKNQFGPSPSKPEQAKPKDDYEKFVEEVGDILNP